MWTKMKHNNERNIAMSQQLRMKNIWAYFSFKELIDTDKFT